MLKVIFKSRFTVFFPLYAMGVLIMPFVVSAGYSGADFFNVFDEDELSGGLGEGLDGANTMVLSSQKLPGYECREANPPYDPRHQCQSVNGMMAPCTGKCVPTRQNNNVRECISPAKHFTCKKGDWSGYVRCMRAAPRDECDPTPKSYDCGVDAEISCQQSTGSCFIIGIKDCSNNYVFNGNENGDCIDINSGCRR
jgi:hypothetical protein